MLPPSKKPTKARLALTNICSKSKPFRIIRKSVRTTLSAFGKIESPNNPVCERSTHDPNSKIGINQGTIRLDMDAYVIFPLIWPETLSGTDTLCSICFNVISPLFKINKPICLI
jgi:hypothetical protein